MTAIKVLITVKTYPTLSVKYDELVCTAGFREDGTWIRLYPIPFRKMGFDDRYSKYQWIELEVEKNTSDPRPESYKPVSYERIKILEKIDADGDDWTKRREIVMKKVYTNLTSLIAKAKDKAICTSLAVFKPKRVLDFVIEADSEEWDQKKLKLLQVKAQQLDLFQKAPNPFQVVNKLPFKFSYKFEDDAGKESKMMIEDWEIGQLYWNCLKRYDGDKTKACIDVKKKYFDDFAKTKDLHFFLGTTREFHFIGVNPFIIIGTFHPKKKIQQTLF